MSFDIFDYKIITGDMMYNTMKSAMIMKIIHFFIYGASGPGGAVSGGFGGAGLCGGPCLSGGLCVSAK